jgi:hypothetical protein
MGRRANVLRWRHAALCCAVLCLQWLERCQDKHPGDTIFALLGTIDTQMKDRGLGDRLQDALVSSE